MLLAVHGEGSGGVRALSLREQRAIIDLEDYMGYVLPRGSSKYSFKDIANSGSGQEDRGKKSAPAIPIKLPPPVKIPPPPTQPAQPKT